MSIFLKSRRLLGCPILLNTRSSPSPIQAEAQPYQEKAFCRGPFGLPVESKCEHRQNRFLPATPAISAFRKAHFYTTFIFLFFLFIPSVQNAQTIISPASNQGLTLSEVVSITLNQNPEILLQKKEITARYGSIVQASGAYQPVFQSAVVQENNLQPLTNADKYNLNGRSFLPVKTTSYRLGLQKLTKNGTILSPGIEFSRVDTDIPNREPENRAEVKFEVRHPLSRGKESESLTFSNVKAADFGYQASKETLRQTVNSSLLYSISAYWTYLSASRRLEILRNAENRAEKLLNETIELIKADHQPASEKSQVEANLASRQAETVAGENALIQEQRTLGLALGLTPEEISTLPLPVANFPDCDSFGDIPSLSMKLLENTLSTRPDLSALRFQERAAERLTVGSKNEELPQVDLDLSVGYSGLDENTRFSSFVTPFSKNVPGLNATIQLQTELPLKNLRALGIRQQREAEQKKIKILVDQTTRKISSGLAVAIANLKDGLRRAGFTKKAVEASHKAVESEKARLTQGMATIGTLQAQKNSVTERIGLLEKLLEKGLVTRQSVVDSQQETQKFDGLIRDAESQLKLIPAENTQSENNRAREMIERQSEISDASRTIELLLKRSEIDSIITSPEDGRTLEIMATEGDLIKQGQSLLSIEPQKTGKSALEAVIYIPLKDGKQIKDGMEVQITPAGIKREEFGFIRGKINSVSPFPATQNGMMTVLGNQQLVQTLTAEGAPIVARAELIPDPSTPSGYKWSSGKGPELLVTSGSLCDVAIVIRTQSPISLVIPKFKELTGL